ncbi:hypothetical protein Ddc_16380 [Ditylenchus destructor]|nr:hypothetical protein Ddc_16380 [Ditylenchus destructor]
MTATRRFFITRFISTALIVSYGPQLTSADLNVTDSEFEKMSVDFCSLMKTTVCCNQGLTRPVQEFCRDPRLKMSCPTSAVTGHGNFTSDFLHLGRLEAIFEPTYIGEPPVQYSTAGGLNVTDSEFSKFESKFCLEMNNFVCCEERMVREQSNVLEEFCYDPRLKLKKSNFDQFYCPPVLTNIALKYYPVSAAGYLDISDLEFEKIATLVEAVNGINICCHKLEVNHGSKPVQAFCRDPRLLSIQVQAYTLAVENGQKDCQLFYPQDPMLCLRRISLDAKSRLLFLSRSHSSTNDSMPKSTAISRLIHKKFLQQNGNNSSVQKRWVRTEVSADKDKSSDDNQKSDAKASETEFKFGFGPSGAKPKNKAEESLYRRLEEIFVKSGRSEEEFEQALKQINPDEIKQRLSAPTRLFARIKYIFRRPFKENLRSCRDYIILPIVVLAAIGFVSKFINLRVYARMVMDNFSKEKPEP